MSGPNNKLYPTGTSGPTSVGPPLRRVDGRLKVTGEARYSAEFPAPDLAHGVLATSTIARGRVAHINRVAAERAPGVLAVLTPENAPRLPAPEARLSLLQSDRVEYQNQPIALVLAETLYQAQAAAALLQVEYVAAPADLDFMAGFAASYPGSHVGQPGDLAWGDYEAGLRQAEVRVDEIYTTPIQHHNPMEPHATMARWEGGRLTVHDSTQHITDVQESLAKIFGLERNDVRVITEFVGGGFGCKGPMWSHVALAAMGARHLGRPVKIVLERRQMFGPIGARPRTHQQLTLGATRQGKLTAIRHEVHSHTSKLENYMEASVFPTRVLYDCPNVTTVSRLVPLNLGTPTYMRAPGVATGTYALEVAMDELAHRLRIDPLDLRLRNYADTDPHTHRPFTEKHLRECYRRGAERFGWARRDAAPGSMRDGRLRVGWGLATETYPGSRLACGAWVRLEPDGHIVVASGTQEIGNGIYTVMTQVTAEALGVRPELIEARLGDTRLPEAPIAAGSMTTASVTPAVQAAALELKRKLRAMNGGADPAPDQFSALLARHGGAAVEGAAQVKPDPAIKNEFSPHSFGAVFAEVAVDPDVGMVRVRRVVAVYDVGKIVNPKLAQSQFLGGIVWGISLALLEDTYVDARLGRIANANLADYLVPVNADIGTIEVEALDIPDPRFGPLGARGIGEIGITGTGAAIANAVFHATGRRVRHLPITPDKLLDPAA